MGRKTNNMKKALMNKALMTALMLLGFAPAALADDLSCVSTTFRLIGKNDEVCVSAFDDPKVPGVACHISQARKGGLGGSLGLAEDPSRFSIACRQIGPITAELDKLTEQRKSLHRAYLDLFQAHERASHGR